MRNLDDGSTLYIRRNGAGYRVEQVARNGVIAAEIECDSIGEARAALHYGPSRW